MIRIHGKIGFGFIQAAPYKTKSDTIDEMQRWSNKTPVQDIIAHIETLDAAYMAGLGESQDAFTGEYFPAAIFTDGKFVFPVDVLRYLKQGNIHGVPKEYEKHIIKTNSR